ncbi:hypothetical protein BY91_18415 [Escherichia coli O157:H7 str. K5806]|uniref:hypothetical protein n=1 Tax=Escherichia Stx1 converting phage TaxID=194948 RepID=UPI00001AA363|nr:hypothetical protein Stx1_p146 [Escherichia Stx1 converting phage]EYV76235.1 hypothetical protein BY91_18415 [Escherichia coli O157:H7 str. K5806]EZB50219.1 hypothetical protein BY61_02900 [Escherichia coli O157:H7 str. K1792]EZB99351.1 hypothetical protein BY70_27155 [Escherichia coli O157:H7 str. K2192]EZC08220.1 hypothetical protein BY72_20550 [Escherichia coli O157:H7 str. K2581]EZC16171.1 hypothetical protein BY74_23915 [Escherichia coli O157:H7 str. K2845]
MPSAPVVNAEPPRQHGTSRMPAFAGINGSNFLAICSPCPTVPYCPFDRSAFGWLRRLMSCTSCRQWSAGMMSLYLQATPPGVTVLRRASCLMRGSGRSYVSGSGRPSPYDMPFDCPARTTTK